MISWFVGFLLGQTFYLFASGITLYFFLLNNKDYCKDKKKELFDKLNNRKEGKMAYPKKMKNGKWRVQVEVGIDPKTGERKRLVRIRDSQEEAEEAWMELKKKIKQDNLGFNEDITIAEHMRNWLTNKKINISHNTYKGYKSNIESHIIPDLGQLPLKNAKPYHFRNYFVNKLENGKLDGSGGLSTQTIRHQYNILNNAFKQAVQDHIIDFNPLENVSVPEVEHEESNPFTKTEVTRMFELLQDYDWLFLIVYIAVFTGMREGEIAALKWKHIDLNNNMIKVRKSAYRKEKEGIKFKKPKTKTSIRDITITDEDVELLKEHRKLQMKDVKYMKEEDKKDRLVFPMRNGSRTDPNRIYQRFKRFLKKHGLGNHDFHDLRHTNASLLHKAGEDIKIIQEKHGHASSSTTSDIYVHLDEDDHRRATNNLKKFMKKDAK